MSPVSGSGANPLRDPADRRLPRIAGPSGLVIFGVTGDLSRKKLMPAVYDLANRGLLPPGFSLVGFARRDWEHEDFAEVVHDAVKEHSRTPFREEVWQQLIQGMRFVQGTFDDDEAFERLRATIEELDKAQGTGGNFAFYLSVPPRSFPVVIQQLKKHGLADQTGGSWRRAVIEKPFGHDLKSAEELNKVVHEVFEPEQVFRIDHYLGKETVQNILALRFANTMFEPIWNRSFVDHVQITMAEDIGIGGRAGYYDGIGAARDVIQNHLLQTRRAGRAVRRSSATSKRRASTRSRRPTPTPRSSWRSTTAAGRASPSTCAPASGSAAGSPRSRSSSSGPRTRRSTRRRPRSSGRTRSSSASSPTRASPSASALRCRAPRWRSGTSPWTSPTASRSRSRARRRTSA